MVIASPPAGHDVALYGEIAGLYLLVMRVMLAGIVRRLRAARDARMRRTV